MKAPRKALFHERDAYRRRRIMDAARILPVVGLVLMLLPALWSRGGGTNVASEAVYLFVLWGVLVLAAALLARPLGSSARREGRPGGALPAIAGRGPGRSNDPAPAGTLPVPAAPDPALAAAPDGAPDDASEPGRGGDGARP